MGKREPAQFRGETGPVEGGSFFAGRQPAGGGPLYGLALDPPTWRTMEADSGPYLDVAP